MKAFKYEVLESHSINKHLFLKGLILYITEPLFPNDDREIYDVGAGYITENRYIDMKLFKIIEEQ